MRRLDISKQIIRLLRRAPFWNTFPLLSLKCWLKGKSSKIILLIFVSNDLNAFNKCTSAKLEAFGLMICLSMASFKGEGKVFFSWKMCSSWLNLFFHLGPCGFLDLPTSRKTIKCANSWRKVIKTRYLFESLLTDIFGISFPVDRWSRLV